MRQYLKPNSIKTTNSLGTAFHTAKPAQKLQYKAALIEASERDNTDYWRAFRDVWQYSETIGKAPYIIPFLATEILGYIYKPQSTSQNV